MQLLKPVDYKLKVHLIINTSSMLKFQLRKHKKSCIGIKLTVDVKRKTPDKEQSPDIN